MLVFNSSWNLLSLTMKILAWVPRFTPQKTWILNIKPPSILHTAKYFTELTAHLYKHKHQSPETHFAPPHTHTHRNITSNFKQVLWDVAQCTGHVAPDILKPQYDPFYKSATKHPGTQHHIPKDLHPQQHHWEPQISYLWFSVTKYWVNWMCTCKENIQKP